MVLHGATHYLATCRSKLLDLAQCGNAVSGVRIGHRLDGNLSPTPDFDIADLYLPGFSHNYTYKTLYSIIIFVIWQEENLKKITIFVKSGR